MAHVVAEDQQGQAADGLVSSSSAISSAESQVSPCCKLVVLQAQHFMLAEQLKGCVQA